MSLKQSLMDIKEAFLERTEIQRTINKIKKATKGETKDEVNINSLVNEIGNVYYSAKESFSKQNIEIKGMFGHPNLELITSKKQIGSRNDPRVFLESLSKNKEFNKRFILQKGTSNQNKEQYMIKEREI